MNSFFRYFIAIILLCVFQLKTIGNLPCGLNAKHTIAGVIEIDESKEEKTEKENYTDKHFLLNSVNKTGWVCGASNMPYLGQYISKFALILHFFAVPTPPPWS